MIKKTSIGFLVNYILGLIFIFLNRHILPKKFFYDSLHIKTLLSNPYSFCLFNSFLNTAYFYKMFGFSTSSSCYLVAIFSYSLCFVCLILFLRRINFIFNFKMFLIFFILNFILSIYVGQYSKEVIAFIIVTLLISIEKNNNLVIYFMLSSPIFLFYTLFFRIYWILIFYFFFIIKICWFYKPRALNYFTKITLFFVLTVILYTTIYYTTNKYLTSSRYIVNLCRIGSPDAQSILVNPLHNTSVITDLLNTILVFIYLIFPFKLFLLKMKLEYIIFVVWQIFNSLFFIKIVYYLSKRKNLIKRWDQTTNCITLIIAFTIVQAMFEPDYGSFLKHQVVLFPAYIYLIFIYFKTKKYCKLLRCLYESNTYS